MVCKNCEKEVNEEMSFCPYCGVSMSSEEVTSMEDKTDLKEIKQYSLKLKRVKREFRKLKRSKARKGIVMFLFTIIMIFSGIKDLSAIYTIETDNYQSEIKKIAQTEKHAFTNYEKEFVNVVIQNREEQVKSCIVSLDNSVNADNYVASLYRHSESKIEEGIFKDKSYYLITDMLKMDKYSLLDTTNNSIYPGAILKGDSLFTGNYTVLETKRSPINLMSNQGNVQPITVTNPNYSNVTIALNQYANDYVGDVSKEWTYHLQSASTSQELNMKLGVGLGKLGDLDLGLNTNNQQTTMAIEYSQIYYTVNAEPLSNATAYFEEGVDLKMLGGYEPAYVSSVDYGRKIVLIVSGDLSEEELSAKLGAHIKGVDIGIGIESVIKDESLKCSLLSYGGEDISSILNSSEANIGLIGEIKTWLWGDDDKKNNESIGDRLNEFLSNGNTLVNPVPVSYSLKYLSDNSPVPAMYINSKSIMLAEKALLVNLSSTDGSEFTIDISALPAIVLNEKDILLQEGKAVGTYLQLLCSDLGTLPININFKNYNNNISVDLADYELEKDIHIDFFALFSTRGIDIYKTQYLGHIQ